MFTFNGIWNTRLRRSVIRSHALHCMTVSLAQGGEGLRAIWGEEKAQEMLRASSFNRVELKKLPHDILNVYYVAQIVQARGWYIEFQLNSLCPLRVLCGECLI